MVESLGKETDLVGYGGEVRKGDRLVFIQELLEIIRNLLQEGQGLVLRSGMEETLAKDIN